mmetsp:Transcript_21958/g.70871  ORF Transcript_21958/g.70871 Transcript_21958/m.70871 type:complete len:244 (-) Transcript_21958:982-1713(-)
MLAYRPACIGSKPSVAARPPFLTKRQSEPVQVTLFHSGAYSPGSCSTVMLVRWHPCTGVRARLGSLPAPGVKLCRKGNLCASPLKKANPRAELPCRSSGSDTVAKPPTPGATTSSPPATPDLAGMPTVYAQRPLPSYSPAVIIVVSTYLTRRYDSTRSPETGLIPPLASVAAAIAIICGVSRRLFTVTNPWYVPSMDEFAGSPPRWTRLAAITYKAAKLEEANGLDSSRGSSGSCWMASAASS